MADPPRRYLPAAGHDWLLPIYDPLVKLLGGDRARQILIEQAALEPGVRVLDIGCGTGSLVLQVLRLRPGVEAMGLDPDPKALARARRKAARARLPAVFEEGFANALPYPDASFDRVLSSFMLHHVHRDDRLDAMREVRRVLKPGGSLHLVDLLPSERDRGDLASRVHPRDALVGSAEARVLELMRTAGLASAQVVGHGSFVVWRLAYYVSRVPAGGLDAQGTRQEV